MIYFIQSHSNTINTVKSLLYQENIVKSPSNPLCPLQNEFKDI